MVSRSRTRHLAYLLSQMMEQEADAKAYPCGHPRTPENTKPHGKQFACRTCRQAIERRAQAKRRAIKQEQAG